MSDIALTALLLALGPGFLAFGIWSLRTKAWRDNVPLAEFVIDRAMGVDPPPRNKSDRRFALIQAWLMVLFGSLVSLALLAVFLSDFVSE